MLNNYLMHYLLYSSSWISFILLVGKLLKRLESPKAYVAVLFFIFELEFSVLDTESF